MDSKKQDNHPLDDLFRGKLSEAPEVKPAGDWLLLQKRLDAHYGKSRRRFFIFFVASCCLVAAIYWAAGDVPFNPQTMTVAKDAPTSGSEMTKNETAIEPAREPAKPNNFDATGGETSNLSGEKQSHYLIQENTETEDSKSRSIKAGSKKTRGKTDQKTTGIEQQEHIKTDLSQANTLIKNDTMNASVVNEPALTSIQPKRQIEKKKPVVEPEEQSAKESFLWVDVHTGVKRTHAMFKGPGQPGYFEKRKEEEQPAYYPSAGIDFRVQLRKLILSLGVELVKYGEEIDYSATAQKRYYFTSGSQVMYRDSLVNDPAFMKQSKNKLAYLELPLQAGYHFPSNGKTGISVTGGLAVGFLTGTDVYYVDTALTGVVQYTDHNNQNFHQQNISVLLQPSFEYRLKNLSEIYISLPLRYQLSSVFNRKYGVKQQYFSPGITVGYRFYRKN